MQMRLIDELKTVDVNRNFADDTPGFWDAFRSSDPGLMAVGGGVDPDAYSPLLRRYHRILWSRELPNGEHMILEEGSRKDYLTWDGHAFGSDSITHSYRRKNMQHIIDQFRETVPDYNQYMEDYMREMYTIGGCIIFPKNGHDGMNPKRGTTKQIDDRWDRTMECIRRHYEGETSPLTSAIEMNSWFFDKFVDFKGYVDFFFLQDCVTSDYSEVIPWVGDLDFGTRALPKDLDEYITWTESNFEFVRKRNARIARFIDES